MYAKSGEFVESIIIAHNVPNNAAKINDISKYLGLEHRLTVLHIISATIKIGNMMNVAMFWVWRLLIEIKYPKYASVYPNTV
jgi:hypothetical protein